MSDRIGNSIQTSSGKRFWPLDPRPSEVSIQDIAHSLANKCRFSGHTTEFYSVAQHSVLVSQECPQEHALWGLLHDAGEAYLVDMPKPLKILPEFQWFVEVENKVQKAISEHFGLNPVEPGCVHTADRVLLITEKRDLMKPMEWDEWQIAYYKEKPMKEIIEPMLPKAAKAAYLARYYQLIQK